MSPREAVVTETNQWLARARSDLDACGVLIAAGLPSEALFHAQQSAEKIDDSAPHLPPDLV
jgi:hypothetical protein